MQRLAAAPVVLVLLLIAGCGGGGGSGQRTEAAKATPTSASTSKLIVRNPANASTTLTIGSKNFTEEFILGEIYAQALKAGGYTIRKRLDSYPEYTGTALTTFFDVAPNKIPKDEQEAYLAAKAGCAESGLTALPPTPFTDSNAVGMTKAHAAELNVQTISDLKRMARQLTLSGSPECRRRLDCKLGLERAYGLHFKRYLP